jgi:hypothetical protein
MLLNSPDNETAFKGLMNENEQFKKLINSQPGRNIEEKFRFLLESTTGVEHFLNVFGTVIGNVEGYLSASYNPLSIFESNPIIFGGLDQQYHVASQEGEPFNFDDLKDGASPNPFTIKKPDVVQNIHFINVYDVYKVTTDILWLNESFLTANIVNTLGAKFIAQQNVQLIQDSFKYSKEMFQLLYTDTLQPTQIATFSEGNSKEERAFNALQKINRMSHKLKFQTRLYNKDKRPDLTPSSDLYCIITSELYQDIRELVRSEKYNVNEIAFVPTIVEIDQFDDMSELDFMLVDRRKGPRIFSRLHRESMRNGANLTVNNWLHRHGQYAYNTFANLIFGMGVDTELEVAAGFATANKILLPKRKTLLKKVETRQKKTKKVE